jgi:hypothetical protein
MRDTGCEGGRSMETGQDPVQHTAIPLEALDFRIFFLPWWQSISDIQVKADTQAINMDIISRYNDEVHFTRLVGSIIRFLTIFTMLLDVTVAASTQFHGTRTYK